MKMKVTRNEVYRHYNKVICIGYCAAQCLLNFEDAVGYNSGVYGWNYDVYSISGVAICTGYRPIGARVNYDLLTEYENKAQHILSYENKASYDEKKEAVKALLREFISKEA